MKKEEAEQLVSLIKEKHPDWEPLASRYRYIVKEWCVILHPDIPLSPVFDEYEEGIQYLQELAYRDVLSEIVAWGHATFPNATPVTVLTHLLRECKEWADDPNDPEEMADVIILIAHLRSHLDRLEKQVYERACIAGFDLAKETRKKLEINQQRVWGEPDAQGVIEHVRTNEERSGGSGQ